VGHPPPTENAQRSFQTSAVGEAESQSLSHPPLTEQSGEKECENYPTQICLTARQDQANPLLPDVKIER
jgi:hypothetical protein